VEDPIPRSHLNYYFIDQDWNRSFYSYYARGKAHATLPVILDSYEAYVNLVCGSESEEGYGLSGATKDTANQTIGKTGLLWYNLLGRVYPVRLFSKSSAIAFYERIPS